MHGKLNAHTLLVVRVDLLDGDLQATLENCLTCRNNPTYNLTMPVTDIFGALANPVRRRILKLLRDNPRAAGDIATEFELNRPAVSEHLQVLRNVGLVSEEVRGRQRFYHLNAAPLSEVEDWLHPFERYWQQRIRALNEVLAKEKLK